MHILCCCFLSVHINLQPKLNSLAQSSKFKLVLVKKTIAFFTIHLKTQTQPTTLVRIRSRTVLHHYLIRMHTIDSFFI